MKKIALILVAALMFSLIATSAVSVFAADGVSEAVTESGEAAPEEASSSDGTKGVAGAVVVAVVAAAGAIGMAIAIAKCAEGMARQPEAAGKINSAMMLGLVFIETAIIYALIVAILIIFVL